MILISQCYENHCENRFSDSRRISSSDLPGIQCNNFFLDLNSVSLVCIQEALENKLPFVIQFITIVATDIDQRYQNSCTVPCNGVISRRALIRVLKHLPTSHAQTSTNIMNLQSLRTCLLVSHAILLLLLIA